MSLLSLPTELLLSITEELPVPALNALTQTSRRLYALLNAELCFVGVNQRCGSQCCASAPSPRIPAACRFQTADQLHPLHWAAVTGNERAMERLLQHGADIDQPALFPEHLKSGNKNWARYQVRENLTTPLGFAVAGGREETVKFLIERGASQQQCTSPLMQGGSIANDISLPPLHIAVLDENVPLMELLLDNGAEVDKKGHTMQTALCLGVIMSSQAIVQRLLGRGAVVNNISVSLGDLRLTESWGNSQVY